MRCFGACLLCFLIGVPDTPCPAAVDYVLDVQPILRKHCYSCHGALRQKSGLRLDHVTFIRQGGNGGPVIETRGATSRLIMAVRGTGETERMPLEDKPLSDKEIGTVETWIDEGAQAPDVPLPRDPTNHWSFQAAVRPPLPPAAEGASSAHPIDRFVAAEHKRRDLSPSPPAAKNLLLRRVYLDLIGLPPAAGELHTFWPTIRAMPTSASSTGCWPVHSMANAGPATGWTCGAIAIGTDSEPRYAKASRTSGGGGIGSSSRSTPTSRTTK